MANRVIRKITVYHPSDIDYPLLRLGSDTEIKLAQVGDVIEVYDGDEDYQKCYEFPSNCIVVKTFDVLGDGRESQYTDYLREEY